MKLQRVFWCLMAGLMAAPVLVWAQTDAHGVEHRQHAAHVHGEAVLNIAMEKGEMEVEFESPASNILGFEHRPSTDEQKQALDKAVAALRDPASVLLVDTVAKCQLEQAEVESELLGGEPGAEKGDGESHSEFHVSYRFACENLDSLQGVKVTVFDHFKGFTNIQAQWITGQLQGSKELNRSDNTITFIR